MTNRTECMRCVRWCVGRLDIDATCSSSVYQSNKHDDDDDSEYVAVDNNYRNKRHIIMAQCENMNTNNAHILNVDDDNELIIS